MDKESLKTYLNDKYKVQTWIIGDAITNEMEVMKYSDYLTIIDDIFSKLHVEKADAESSLEADQDRTPVA